MCCTIKNHFRTVCFNSQFCQYGNNSKAHFFKALQLVLECVTDFKKFLKRRLKLASYYKMIVKKLCSFSERNFPRFQKFSTVSGKMESIEFYCRRHKNI